jgi:hypothetical protein
MDLTHIKDGCKQPIKVQFVKGVLAMVDILADDSDAKKHCDLCRTEIERSEANVVKVAEAIVGFINPFEMEQKSKPDKPALPPPAPPCDLECFIKVSSIVLSTGHLFPGTKDLATLMAPLFNKSVSSYIDAYVKFRHDARTGHLGKTAHLTSGSFYN